jgi:hypothetical protein
MNNVKKNNRIMQYVVLALAASAMIVLVILVVPMTAIPAMVRGTYGQGGGGGGDTPLTTPATSPDNVAAVFGTVSFSVPGAIAVGTPGTVMVVLSGPDAIGVDLSSLTFAGAPVESWSYDSSGSLVLVFDKATMNLKPGDTTTMLSGKLNNGDPFGGAIPVTVVQ